LRNSGSPRSYFLSILAGLLTPFPLLTVLHLLQVFVMSSASPPLGWKTQLASAFLFALGVALWRPIHPLLYGVALAPSFAVWFFILSGSARSENLFGLGFIVLFLSGAIIGGSAGLCGWLARRWSFPSWISAAPISAACLLVIFGQQYQAQKANQATSEIMAFLQQIRAAEQTYAAARPDHAYTCNGPDLPSVTGIEWRTDYNFGGIDRNQGEHNRFWVTLRCEPRAFRATAAALWPRGPRFTLDSRSPVITPE